MNDLTVVLGRIEGETFIFKGLELDTGSDVKVTWEADTRNGDVSELISEFGGLLKRLLESKDEYSARCSIEVLLKKKDS